MMDIRFYSARSDFFDLFPELRADIPCYTPNLNCMLPSSEFELLAQDIQLEIDDQSDESSSRDSNYELALERISTI